ncbi:cyclic AMP-responsive element-binding protein 3-like protein 3-A isoform X1 [Takifugu flavidus]|uniref:Cyclic AMP-responsive element-binding protein 3-like protein 3-B n=1 Tax=Takifugu flavidus TaxID=433684 RepID=A0A5C6MW76_9TELE|nr:cyclic AMP-responsive element-binding protein 3-like protein 3-A isoform X1 [Takifugu flavidus]TWW57760.1 Cyclic AMP-responsive element-binding protein 3-like protein 3-B [Takifugu flavidus]
MEYYPEQGCDGAELLDWLFDQNDTVEKLEWLFDPNDSSLRHEGAGNHSNHQNWPVSEENMQQMTNQADSDFLNTLLSASVSDSPVWSPNPSDSGISEDPPSDQVDSPQRPESPQGDAPYFAPRSKRSPDSNFPTDRNSWNKTFSMSKYLRPSDAHRPLPSEYPLTVKDLLLSGAPEHQAPQTSQQSVQELILNEDEKKLLAKEGVTLPNQLPLTKCEERVLKKIRRKIRNKQSAQESRKKKKEYIDGLESRMAACNAHNQELQRKVSQLEKCNMSLMEQLRRLQALVMNTSNKPAQTGTCVLVLLLSFSLILFPSLKPLSDTKVSEGDFSAIRIQSRSLQNIQASRVLHIPEPPYPAEDKAENLSRDSSTKVDLEEIAARMEKLRVTQERSSLESVSQNYSQEEGLGHFHVDPITGHIAALTWDPQQSERLRPHADDM